MKIGYNMFQYETDVRREIRYVKNRVGKKRGVLGKQNRSERGFLPGWHRNGDFVKQGLHRGLLKKGDQD